MKEFGDISGDPVLEFCEDWMLADEVTHVKMGSDWLRRLTDEQPGAPQGRARVPARSSTSSSPSAASAASPRSPDQAGPALPRARRLRHRRDRRDRPPVRGSAARGRRQAATKSAPRRRRPSQSDGRHRHSREVHDGELRRRRRSPRSPRSCSIRSASPISTCRSRSTRRAHSAARTSRRSTRW